jgi:hypothetical protein
MVDNGKLPFPVASIGLSLLLMYRIYIIEILVPTIPGLVESYANFRIRSNVH